MNTLTATAPAPVANPRTYTAQQKKELATYRDIYKGRNGQYALFCLALDWSTIEHDSPIVLKQHDASFIQGRYHRAASIEGGGFYIVQPIAGSTKTREFLVSPERVFQVWVPTACTCGCNCR